MDGKEEFRYVPAYIALVVPGNYAKNFEQFCMLTEVFKYKNSIVPK